MDEAAILIQRSYREYRRRRIRGRVRLCLAKFFAAVRFLVLYQTSAGAASWLVSIESKSIQMKS